LLNKGRIFHDLLLNPLIDEFVPEVLGEHPILTGIVSIIATPGGKTTTMHLDQSFVQPEVPQFQTGINILWFLDDVCEANGGTRIMPASHKGGIGPADPSTPEGTIAAEGPAGTALLLDSRVWHATGNNRTDKARHLVVSYLSRSFMRAQENYFLSLRPELEDTLDEKVKVMLGYRCTGSLGAVEGPIEGKMNSRLSNPVGELKPMERATP
jgi:ectoine hydroxylase-related dioxygenase (phytanoyl-CoA dioxygenase family)